MTEHSTLALSNSIKIETKTNYLPAQSSKNDSRFVFSYTITITNTSNDPVQLMSRYWQINDADGKESIVEGEGVIGQQPVIEPNSSYTYTSGSIFKTPIGTMQGHYVMQDKHQHSFLAQIPVFRLAIPNILN